MPVRLKNWPDLKVAGHRNTLQPERISGALTPTDFLLSWGKSKKYSIKTYGCQANVRDSEILSAYLEKIGLHCAEVENEADIIIFNTCAIREHAETRLQGELGRISHFARKNKDLIVCMCGCIAQEDEPLTFLKDHYPFLNLVFGTHNIHQIYSLLEECILSKQRIFDVPSNADYLVEDYPIKRFERYKAFVNIMYGCDKFCTYCIVPFTRGKQRSRDKKDILEEIENLIKAGYKEVTLLGQNVNSFGFDKKDDYHFHHLLEDVAKTGIDRIRFMSSHPFDFEDEVFEVMGKYKNIMPSLHLPLQSGSSKVLKAMNRRYDRETYIGLVERLRTHVKDVRLTTDIIVAFPTETEDDLLETISLIKELHFAAGYNFIYSPRIGTPASRLPCSLPDEEKHRRFQLVQNALDQEATAIGASLVGTTVEVLFDSVDEVEGRIRGYDQYGKLIHVQASFDLVGAIRKVRITLSRTYSYIGELV